jgi:ferredoxin
LDAGGRVLWAVGRKPPESDRGPKEGTIRLYVDQEECISCELCTQICGEVFEMRDDGKSHVKEGADQNAGCVDDAIDQCPVSCIHRGS